MNDIKTMTQIKKLCEAYMYYYATGGDSEPVGDSYVQLSNGKLIYFDATNTTVNDIVNFTFNGKTVDRFFIQHLSFGESYLTVTSLPDGFCSYMDNLLSVNTDNFINVTSVGEEVFANLYSLEHFDFTNFGNLVNAGRNFLISMNSIVSIDLSNINENFRAALGMLAWCQTISEIIINDTTNINFGSYFLYGVPNDSSRNIVASNNDLVNIFKSKAHDNAISEWSGLVENDSYIQLANDELIYFNATNTPVTNLVYNNYIINGQPVNPGDIKHIEFGDSYLTVTSLPEYFCRGLGIETIGLSGLANVTTFGYECFAYLRSLKHFDFTVFKQPISSPGFSNFLIGATAIESVDISQYHVESNLRGAFIDCMNLKEIIINDTDFSNHGDMSYWFYRVNNDSSRKIKASSQELVDILKSKTNGNISNWTVDCPFPSYYTLVSDPETRIPFHIDNTPLANFCTSYADTESITINGQSVVKNTIKELSFEDEYSIMTSINNNFLKNCTGLTSVDLSPFSNVTSIGTDFLHGCSSLTSIDLSSFVDVTTIGDTFLQGCSSLTSIDLSPFSNVTSIGDTFLSECTSLTSVDLAPLHKIKTIGGYFMYVCTGLTSIDLSPLSDATIGASILRDSSGLTTIKLNAPLNGLTASADNFYTSTPRSGTIITDTNNDTFGNNLKANNSALSTWTVQTGDVDILPYAYQPLDTNFNSVLPVKVPTSSSLSTHSSFNNCLQVNQFDYETYSLIDLGTPQNIQVGDCLSFWFAPIDIARIGYNIYEHIGDADVFGPVVIRTDGWNALTMAWDGGMLQPRYYDDRWGASIIDVQDPTWHFVQIWIDETNDGYLIVRTYIDNELVNSKVCGHEGIPYNTFGFSLGNIRGSIPGYYHRSSFTNVNPAGRELIYKNAGIISPVLPQ